jgi:ABC transporter substrate binding protein
MPYKIGFLIASTKTGWQKYTDAFEQGLSTYGWVKDVDYTIDYEPKNGAAGVKVAIQNAADAFVAAGVNNINIIVTAGTEAALACQAATQTQPAGSRTPVVFASVGDPVDSGLVTTIPTPGGNLTGCSNLQADPQILRTRVNVLKTKLGPNKVGVIGNNPPPPAGPLSPIEKAMKNALTELNNAHIPTTHKVLGQWAAGDFQSKAACLAKLAPLKADGVDVLLVCSDPVVSANVDYLIAAAHDPQMKMKTMHEFREHVDHPHNGNQCYGPNFPRLFSQAASFVYQILQNHTDPGTLAVYKPSPPYDQVPP